MVVDPRSDSKSKLQRKFALKLCEVLYEITKVFSEANEKKMTEVSRKVAQKIQVNNLIRSMKMTELEKYSKNPGMIVTKKQY